MGRRTYLLCLAVFVYLAVALAVGARSFTQYFTLPWLLETSAVLGLPLLAWMAIIGVRAARRSSSRPLKTMLRMIRKDRERLSVALLLLILFAFTNRAYRALKVAIPNHVDFYLDPALVALDRRLFGTDPWRITHAVFDTGATRVLDALYVIWLPVMLGTFAWAAFASDRRFQFQASASYLLVWIIIGSAAAFGLSSAGPCYFSHFFGSDYYAPLMERLSGQELFAPAIQEYLLSITGDESIGSGISAMPSVHVAMTTLLVLMLYRHYRWRWPTWVGAAYWLAIFTGSIHLAWHYAVDGIVSLGLTLLIWTAIGSVESQPRLRRPLTLRPAEARPAALEVP